MNLTKENLKIGLKVECSHGSAVITEITEKGFKYTLDTPFNLGFHAGKPVGFITEGEAFEKPYGFVGWKVLD